MYQIDITTITGFAALSQSILLGIYLVVSSQRRTVHILMSLFLLAISISLFHSVLLHSKLALSYPHILGLGPFATYLIGPFILLLALKVISPDKKLSLWHLLHFIPFFVHQYLRLPAYTLPREDKLAFLENFYQYRLTMTHEEFNLEWLWNITHYYGHRVLYIGVTLFLVKRLASKIAGANETRVLFLKYLSMFLYCYLAIWATLLIGRLFPETGVIIYDYMVIIHAEGLIILSLFIAYFFFKHPASQLSAENAKQKYATSGLDDDLSQQVLTEINKIIESEALYTIPDLKQADLATKTGFTVANISQAINQQLGMNFNEYINRFRIANVKTLLNSEKAHNLDTQSIALESGFSSKATFYRIFKESEGMTPGEYRKSLSH